MRRKASLDPDYASFLLTYAASGVFVTGSAEARLIRIVAYRGLSGLNFRQTRLWYETILPVISKPLDEQVAVARIIRSGGLVPTRVKANADAGSEDEARPHLFPLPEDLDAATSRLDLAALAKALRSAA